jgi:LysM repeat protein
MSACVVLAWCILPLVAAAGSQGPDHVVAQPSISTPASTSIASTSIASSTRAVLASESVTAVNTEVTAAQVTAQPAARWTVRPGDTLSAIAVALGIPGGWQALYATNRPVIGPDPNVIHAGAVLAVPGRQEPARYTVAPGDTLSAIAAVLGVRGGWQALYAANKEAVGPDPNVIQAGAVLSVPAAGYQAAPHQAAPHQAAPHQVPPTAPAAGQSTRPQRAPAPTPASSQRASSQRASTQQGSTQQGSSQPAASRPANRTAPGHLAAPGHFTVPAGGMPRWLEDVLLAAGVLAATAFAAEPAAAFARRRRRSARAARPYAASRGPGATRHVAATARHAAEKARIILADHERLIVTYCAHDHAVYVLTPPGEDPRTVLRAARLVLPEDTYEDLAGHLGVPSGWPLE